MDMPTATVATRNRNSTAEPNSSTKRRYDRWNSASWRGREILQQASYPDQAMLECTAARLACLPGLVTAQQIESLRRRLSEAALGHRLLLQGGDCAERFDHCQARPITSTSQLLGDMAAVLQRAFSRPVTTVARLAGQYAKPRSSDFEVQDGVSLPSYRGDLVNGRSFTANERRPQPARLLEAYRHADASLAIVRRATRHWSEPLYVSHENLHLHYEAALVRSNGASAVNLSTHLPWIGMRTAFPNAAQVELLRGVSNPLALKVGPAMDSDRLCRLAEILDPQRRPGRLTLIHRFGADRVERCLPPLVDAMRTSGHPVLWVSDPMHGNTVTTSNGHKTRRFERIFSELEMAFSVHDALGSRLGGLHLELTGDDVTECTGGSCGLTENDLDRRYESPVDPRLNRSQALELAHRVAALVPQLRSHRSSGRLLPFPRPISV